MDAFKDFRQKKFAEQIGILAYVQDNKNNDALPHLFDLFTDPVNDTMVDHLVITALQSILSCNEDIVLEILRTGEEPLKKLCIDIVNSNGFGNAVPLLHEMLEDEKNSQIFNEILFTLAKFKTPASIKYFRKFINSSDDLTSATCLEMIGVYRDEESAEMLCRIVDDGDNSDHSEVCFLKAATAIDSLAAINSDSVLSFFVSRMHHRNATLRRKIQDALISAGHRAISFIKPVFSENDKNMIILSANILGFIGDKRGGEVLLDFIDSGRAVDPNVKYAVYDALGKISFLKGLMCLLDALYSENDSLIILSVVTSLNGNRNPGIITAISEIIENGGIQADLVVNAIVSSKAINLFLELYKNEKTATAIVSKIAQFNDFEISGAFIDALSSIGGDRAQKDIGLLSITKTVSTGKSMLAVDDSRPMLSFYSTVAADLGFSITVSSNGKDALGHIESGKDFDIIITDMNMPGMDGIEFATRLRNCIGYEDIPIIMVTTESEQSQRELAVKAGVTIFMTKPFTFDEVKEKIQGIQP